MAVVLGFEHSNRDVGPEVIPARSLDGRGGQLGSDVSF